MRVNYWSNSKFANWIRGTKKPYALEMSEWNEWERKAEDAHSFRYWFAEKFLDSVQNVVNYPTDKLHSFVYWINRRFIDQSHIIKTDLKKGDWHESDEKILHGMFTELQNFVEVQKAHMSWHREDKKHDRKKNDHFVPWTEKNWFTRNLSDWKSEHYGIQHLIWEIGLKWDEDLMDKDNEDYGKPTYQAIAAMEVMELYVWWKYLRPMRPDPMEASGYTEYFDSLRSRGIDIWQNEKTEEDILWRDAASDLCQAYEEQYDQEDEEMMFRLIKIRKNLWT